MSKPSNCVGEDEVQRIPKVVNRYLLPTPEPVPPRILFTIARLMRTTTVNVGMLLNNLDPEVAEKPEELVVYGGRARVRGFGCGEQARGRGTGSA
jgi:hypothetical protein